MKPQRSLLDQALGWTDRLLPVELREHPLLHLQAQIGLFLSIPGSAVSFLLVAYSSTLTVGGVQTLLPFIIGQTLVTASVILLVRPKYTQAGLTTMGCLTTGMVIYASYITGGLGTVTTTWFLAVPVMLSLFAGRRAAVIGTVFCVSALIVFWGLEEIGHDFPQVTAPSSLLWVVVVSWGTLTTAGIAIYTHGSFESAVTSYKSEIKRRTKVEQSLRRAQQRLRLAKGVAEAGSSAKGAFLAQVSHEIRNPLTAIMGTIDLLELPADETVRRSRIELLRRSSEALLELVDDVLDFSKIESGRIEINPRPVDPAALAEELERTYRPQALERGIELYLELDPNLPRVAKIDALRVRQVLVNMMSNALKFTTEGSITIEVWTATTEGDLPGLTFGVEDTGIGIPEEAHAQIFEPYMQAERSTTEQYGGTGLGLPICSRLTALMGGQLGFETEVGEGTRFWFTIPADMQPTTSDERGTQLGENPNGAHVLVVEDDPMNRQVVGDLLISLGHRVTLASSGDEGVLKYTEAQPDLVLMDIQMPELNGMEASIKIRHWEQRNKSQPVPILAMTADVEVHRVARYGEAGMNDLLGKPINREKLESAVMGWAVQYKHGPNNSA